MDIPQKNMVIRSLTVLTYSLVKIRRILELDILSLMLFLLKLQLQITKGTPQSLRPHTTTVSAGTARATTLVTLYLLASGKTQQCQCQIPNFFSTVLSQNTTFPHSTTASLLLQIRYRGKDQHLRERLDKTLVS
jgi:hypothetical protein